MRILTRNQARELDRIAITEKKIPGIVLMGNAGKKVAETARTLLENEKSPKIAIVCGKGNNGGDGFAAALQLSQNNMNLVIYSLPVPSDIKGDAQHYFKQCENKGFSIIHGTELPPEDDFRLIIDGLLGTGFAGEIRSPVSEWTNWINSQSVPVLSIDVASGVDADNGLCAENAVTATVTVTMEYPKLGMMIEPGRQHCGKIIPVPVGFPDILSELPGSQWAAFDESLAYRYLCPPPREIYKHRQGKALILAGSTGMTGAAIMSSLGTLRSGAGLTVTCAPASINSIYESNLLEGMTLSCQDDNKGFFQESNFNEISAFFDWCSVLLIGPGLGQDKSTLALIERVLAVIDKPVVMDADGLRIFVTNPDLFHQLKAPLVITPHFGEFGSIIGKSQDDIKLHFPEIVEQFMKDFPGVLVLKNAPTFTAFQKNIIVNTSGNQGLATAGTGDVLAGIITGFIAQGIPPFEAAQLAVYIHGSAADIAMCELGFRGILASDILRTIPSAIKKYENQ